MKNSQNLENFPFNPEKSPALRSLALLFVFPASYSVVRTVPASVEQLRLLDELIAKKALQAWTRPRLGGQLDLGVPAGALPEVRQYLASVGIDHRVLHDNLQE